MIRTSIDEVFSKATKFSDAEAWRFAQNNPDILPRIREWIKDQLDEGVDENDIIIGYYSPSNRLRKGRATYNLLETGYFRNSIVIYFTPNGILIDADAQKPDANLFELYGQGIVGLTADHMDELTEIFRNEFIKYALSLLQTR